MEKIQTRTLTKQQKEHGERDENRDTQRDFLSTIRWQVEDQSCEETETIRFLGGKLSWYVYKPDTNRWDHQVDSVKESFPL